MLENVHGTYSIFAGLSNLKMVNCLWFDVVGSPRKYKPRITAFHGIKMQKKVWYWLKTTAQTKKGTRSLDNRTMFYEFWCALTETTDIGAMSRASPCESGAAMTTISGRGNPRDSEIASYISRLVANMTMPRFAQSYFAVELFTLRFPVFALVMPPRWPYTFRCDLFALNQPESIVNKSIKRNKSCIPHCVINSYALTRSYSEQKQKINKLCDTAVLYTI